MGSISVDTGTSSGSEYYDYLKLNVTDFGTQKLEEKQEEIEVRDTQKMAGSQTSNTTYILLAVAAVAVITLAVLKKKGII